MNQPSQDRMTFRERVASWFDGAYLRRVGAVVAVSILGVGVLAYLGVHIAQHFEPGLELVDAVVKTVTTTVDGDGYIMRRETPVYAASARGGAVTAALADGGKAARGSLLAEVYADSSPEIETRISEIDLQIAQLKKTASEERSVQSAAGLESSIYEKVFAFAADCSEGRYGDALARRVGLLIDMQKRSAARGGSIDTDGQISALQLERTTLMSQLGASLETVYAARSGYYYAEYDGYGEIFSADKLDGLTYDGFMALTDEEPVFGETLSVGTLLTDFNWYVVVPVAKEEAAQLLDARACSVEFVAQNRTFDMTLESILTEAGGDGAALVLRCEIVPSAFDFSRMQRVRISAVDYVGYELPMEALRMVEGYQGVYVQDGTTIRFRRVEIIHENEDGSVICVGNSAENAEIRQQVRALNSEAIRQDSAIRYDETSLGTYYWIEENDVVVVGGRDLYQGKIIG